MTTDTVASSSLLKNVSRYEDVKEAAKKTKEDMGKQEFLTLFTAQLQNQDPLEPDIPCPASSQYSKAYLHHLIRADEILGKVLLSWHNIAFFQALTAAMRAAIAENRFEAFRRDFHARHTSN